MKEEKEQIDFYKNLQSNKSKGITIKMGPILVIIAIIIVLFLLFNRKVPKYSITFESNGGSIIATMSVSENGTIVKPENPTKENYEFLGWYYNNVLWDFSKPVTDDMILEAKWGKVTGVTGIKLEETELTLQIGDTVELTARVEPEGATDKRVTWKSSDSEIVKVDSNGNITALKEGSVTITVTSKDGEYTAEAKVTVEPEEIVQPSVDGEPVKVTRVTLNKTTLTLTVGQTSKLTATVKPTNAKNKNVTWKSSNSNIISVDANGNIRAIAAGTATITVTTQDGQHTAKATINVNKANTDNPPVVTQSVKVTGVTLNKTALTLTVGQNSKLTATVNPSNADNKTVTWSSSNSSIVSVDSSGNVKALKAGSATITVTTQDGNYKATCQVTVNANVTPPVKVTGVTLNKTSLTLTEGDSSKLTATVNPSNADNKNVTWLSSNPSIVSVDASGNVRALKAGSATITVTTQDGSYKATCQVTVNAKPANYSVILTPIVQEGTGAIVQYSVAVTKNNATFNNYSFIIYGGKKVGSTLPAAQYNRNNTTATIRLTDGTNVEATVVYK